MSACQTAAGGCHEPATVRVVHQTASLTGRHTGPGLEFVTGVCRSHRDGFMDEVRRAGGTIIGIEKTVEQSS